MPPSIPSIASDASTDEPAVPAVEAQQQVASMPFADVPVRTEQWEILSSYEYEVPADVMQDLRDPARGIDRIHGGLKDLLIRHGDDGGGWSVDLPKDSRAHQWLEAVREEAGYPSSGASYYYLIIAD